MGQYTHPLDDELKPNELTLETGVIVRNGDQILNRLRKTTSHIDESILKGIASNLLLEYKIGQFKSLNSYFKKLHKHRSMQLRVDPNDIESEGHNLSTVLDIIEKINPKCKIFEIVHVESINKRIFGYQNAHTFDVVLQCLDFSGVLVFNIGQEYDIRSLFITCSRKFLKEHKKRINSSF